MAFDFPPVPDVRLDLAPLMEVVCQVRFPPILRIANEQPAEFQERIRAQFPQMGIEQGMLVKFAPPAPPLPIDTQPAIYRFSSADGQTAVSLATDFFALSTQAYTHWRDFAQLFDLVQQAASEVYRLPYATRIGLRYINRVRPDRLGVDGRENILGLIRPELTAALRVAPLTAANAMLSQITWSQGAERLVLRVGFGADESAAFILLDFDHFVEGQTALDDLMARCGRYHDTIYNAFRWSIPAEQLTRFGPRPVE